MSLNDTRFGTSAWRIPGLLASVTLMSIGLTWTYLGMRAVMDVGGTCAEGGPYVIETPCPDGSGLLSLGIPIVLLAMFAGSAIAFSIKAPTLALPMWAALFGSLGWNFLDYGLRGEDGPVADWIVCGVVFWVMAAPALFLMPWVDAIKGSREGLGSVRRSGRGMWWAIYALIGVLGVALGVWSFNSWT